MVQRTIKKLEQLIKEAAPFVEKSKKSEESIIFAMDIRHGEYGAYTASVLQTLKLILDPTSPYLKEYNKNALPYKSKCVQNGIDILTRILQDVKDGWLLEMKGLLTAEIFSDFMEMASHLVNEGYKDPAVVIIGSVLEEHLRNLCLKNGISITVSDGKGKISSKKASTMNDELTKAGVYNGLEQKSVTAWLDLRNKAAHGKYNDYEMSHVQNMLQNVNDFLVRNPI